MIRTNLHTHSIYDDGHDSIQDMVEKARKLGFSAIGFSGHSPVAFDSSTMSSGSMAVWKQDVLRAREEGGLDVFLGLELDSYSNLPLDDFEYIIGSVHYLAPAGIPVAIDSSRQLFDQLLTQDYHSDIYALARDYYNAIQALIENRPLTIIGHFDLLSKYNEDESYFRFDDPKMLEIALNAAESAIERGMLFEINTGAIARGYRSQPYPHGALLRALKEAGASFILSSDCHSREQLEAGYDTALQACLDAGIDELMVPVRKDGRLVFERAFLRG